MPGGRVTRFTYDSNGNATSYFNSSYQSGKAPSPDAPRIEDVTADSVYYCSIAKKVPNTNALGAGDYGSAALSQAWDSVVAWAKTDKGQKILMTALSVAEVAGGIAITAATGGSAGLLIAAVGAGLVGGGASSLIGGYLTEKIGGDFKTGWISRQISGAITGAGIGAGSLGFSSVALDIGASAKQVLGGDNDSCWFIWLSWFYWWDIIFHLYPMVK